EIARIWKDGVCRRVRAPCRREIDSLDVRRIAQQWEWPEHEPIDDAEHRDAGADAESEGERYRDRDGGGSAKGAPGVANVLLCMVEPWNAPAIARLFGHSSDVAELSTCTPACVVGLCSRLAGVALELRLMKAQLILKLGVQPIAAEPIGQPCEPFAHDVVSR